MKVQMNVKELQHSHVHCIYRDSMKAYRDVEVESHVIQNKDGPHGFRQLILCGTQTDVNATIQYNVTGQIVKDYYF